MSRKSKVFGLKFFKNILKTKKIQNNLHDLKNICQTQKYKKPIPKDREKIREHGMDNYILFLLAIGREIIF